MRNELQRALFPGLGKRKGAAGRARNRQSFEAGGFEVLVEHADRIAADYVARSRNGIGRNRYAAGQCLELNEAKSIGPAWKHEHIRRGEMRCEVFPFQLTKKMDFGKAALQLARLRPVANDDFGARHV